MAITKASSSAVAPAAKGDLVVGSATNDAAVLGVGSNDQVLTADSSTATGLKWATASAGGMTLISETVASAISSLSLSSIPQTYKQLFLIWSGINHNAASCKFEIRLNNDSAANYSGHGSYFANGTLGGLSGNYTILGNNDVAAFGNDNGNIGTAIAAARGSILIDNYASTSKFKYCQMTWAYRNSSASDYQLIQQNTTYQSTTAITSIDVFRASGASTFSNIANTSIRLYGIS